eukprot:TRINITY_DN8840_c0_g1_i1.p1 TRINITY_DN8840_c0_g1~~TRINITY_DN8840_c0_g1_i1.p1  ORF type:complete len:109 (+),score=10.27 TRINITY_DN8840_c0_g1_i1:267-593(+)
MLVQWCDTNGIFFHDWADVTIYKSCLQHQLDANVLILADKGYIGGNKCLCPIKGRGDDPLTDLELEHNAYVGRYRAKVENLNADLQIFGPFYATLKVKIYLFCCNVMF